MFHFPTFGSLFGDYLLAFHGTLVGGLAPIREILRSSKGFCGTGSIGEVIREFLSYAPLMGSILARGSPGLALKSSSKGAPFLIFLGVWPLPLLTLILLG